MFNANDLSFHIISLGCSKNQVDSEYLKGELVSAGFQEAETSDTSNLLFINTCGFITPAKEEAIDVILDALAQREDSSDKTGFGCHVVVLGCLTERYFDEIANEIPEIDLIYGLYDDNLLNRVCDKFNIEKEPVKGKTREPLIEGLSYAYVKIAEGCSNRCSYCAIPSIRGNHRSFDPDDIIRDAHKCFKDGARELVIVAQDIAAYKSGETDLPGLLRLIAKEIPDAWIRLMYCHPDHITDEIIQVIAEVPSIVKYIDIPFQHVSEKVLKSMNRSGSSEKYSDLVRRFREIIPSIRIRSTFMVGYPGETDADFRELLGFIKSAELDRVGCFIYSPEEGTPAFQYGETVTQSIKKKRYNRLMKIQQNISMKKLERMVGSEVRVLVEEKVDDYNWIGRSEYDAPEVDGIFYLTGHNLNINSIVRAKVTDSVEYDLIGEILETR